LEQRDAEVGCVDSGGVRGAGGGDGADLFLAGARGGQSRAFIGMEQDGTVGDGFAGGGGLESEMDYTEPP